MCGDISPTFPAHLFKIDDYDLQSRRLRSSLSHAAKLIHYSSDQILRSRKLRCVVPARTQALSVSRLVSSIDDVFLWFEVYRGEPITLEKRYISWSVSHFARFAESNTSTPCCTYLIKGSFLCKRLGIRRSNMRIAWLGLTTGVLLPRALSHTDLKCKGKISNYERENHSFLRWVVQPSLPWLANSASTSSRICNGVQRKF